MQYVLAALMLHETGAEINEQYLTAVIEAADGTVEESRTKALVAALEGVDIEAIVADGAGLTLPVTDEADAPDREPSPSDDEPDGTTTNETDGEAEQVVAVTGDESAEAGTADGDHSDASDGQSTGAAEGGGADPAEVTGDPDGIEGDR